MAVVSLFLAMAHPAAAEPASADTSTSDAVVRKTIEKSLPFIEEKGLYWIEKKKCVSCHRVSFMTWSLSSAARRGFDVDLAKVNEWIEWSIEQDVPQPEGDKPAATKNADGLTQQLLSRHEYPPGKTHTDDWAKYVDLISAAQNDAGLWKPAGQLPGQKRKLAETTDVSSVWHTLALTQALDGEPDSAKKTALKSAIDKATNKFNVRKDAASTEWYVARLLLASESGDESTVQAATAELLSIQKPDGSWGWLKADPGDALATGMSLYALVKSVDAGAEQSDAAQRAIRFLVSTQREDGSWAVKGTKEKKKTKVEETAVYWGTTWAAIALLETLPVVE